MDILRSENGCPWDREQTHKSIRKEFIEEVYEAVEGIDKEDNDILKEELGDVLFQIVFHSCIAKEENAFDISDVIDGIAKKMILRHPHVFSDVNADTTDEVLKNWDSIKQVEKNQNTASDTLRAVSSAFPSVVRAQKLQSKAAKVGFTFSDSLNALSKLNEELHELEDAIGEGNKNDIKEEIGDLLFAVVNIARLEGIDAEEALYFTNEKFLSRFEKMEKMADSNNMKLCEQDINTLLDFWRKSKN